MNPWIILGVAGLFEIAWAVGFKYAWGRGWGWNAFCLATLVLSMVLLIRALQDLPVGTAYAVWTGIGAVGVAALGIIFFREPATFARIAFIALIVFGIIGLKLSSGNGAA